MTRTQDAAYRLDWPLVGLAVCLLFPALSKVQRYFGLTPVPAYICVVFIALLLARRYVWPWLMHRLTQQQVLWLAVVTVMALIGAFVVVYPIADSGIVGGGSDRDEALNIGVTELLHGRYPYHRHTVEGNPLSPLPGSLLLAIPFVLLGNSAYQNFLWVLLFFVAVRWHLRDGRPALLLLWTMLALSPIVLHEVVTGGDLLANTLWVFVFVLMVVRCVPSPTVSRGAKIAWAILLGIGLSSRLNFVLLLPLGFSMLVQHAGWQQAAKYTALTCLTFAVITLPFYLYDPQGFSPLHAYNKLARFESILPAAGLLIPAVTTLVAMALSWQRMAADCLVLLRNCAIVQAVPVVAAVVLSSLGSGHLNFDDFAWYGLSFMVFGALAAWISMCSADSQLGPYSHER